MPNFRTAADARPALDLLDRYLTEAGRPRASFGLEARLAYGDGDPGAWTEAIRGWQTAGATHLYLNTLGRGFESPADHLAALRRFAEAVGLA